MGEQTPNTKYDAQFLLFNLVITRKQQVVLPLILYSQTVIIVTVYILFL
jgi:hypothetical protein